MKSCLWIVALAALCAAQSFRSKVETIVMGVSVLDRKGEPVVTVRARPGYWR